MGTQYGEGWGGGHLYANPMFFWVGIKEHDGCSKRGPLFWLPVWKGAELSSAKWVWVIMKPPGYGPQLVVQVSICQGSILGTYS